MGKWWAGIGLVAALGAQSAFADTIRVACEGCGEQEYRQAALEAANYEDPVLVMDFLNGELRKYVVTLVESFDGGRLSVESFRVTPTRKELVEFYDVKEVTDDIYSSIEGFCGPGAVGDRFVPDFNFGEACAAHDRCYEQGGNDQDRKVCDLNLRREIYAMTGSWLLANVYYVAVRAAGWASFNYGRFWSSSTSCLYFEVCDAFVDLPSDWS